MISFLDSQFSDLNSFIQSEKPSQLLILVDENTHEYCLPTLLGNLETDIPFEIIEIEAGEEMKTLETVFQLLEILAEFQADRKALLMNLGGGVISDIGGFVASIYKRGIPFVHIPTTLLAMSDASIGGKTGVDFQFIKNLVGTFALPERIFVYPDFLKTLPPIELQSGFAEMLKHGLIASKHHWVDLTNISEISVENITPLLNTTMEIKQNIVEQDFLEKNIRKTLNFGHTIGHSIESIFLKNQQQITHGQAVAAGMIIESNLASKIGLLSENQTIEIQEKIKHFFGIISLENIDNEEIIQIMLHDKKNDNGSIRFSLIPEIGNCLHDVEAPLEKILVSIDEYRNFE